MVVAATLGNALWTPARAQSGYVTDVIPLGYSSVEEILPVVAPLVPPPGVVTGMYNQLVVKTTPANLREIKNLLATLDRAPANLMISVRHELDEDIRRDLASASVRLQTRSINATAGQPAQRSKGLSVSHSSGKAAVNARLSSSSRSNSGRDVQRVRVLEGRQGFIETGTRVPIRQSNIIVTRNGVRQTQSHQYQNVTSGFFVRPRLNQDQVNLEITHHKDQIQSGASRSSTRRPSAMSTSGASTTISGQLGRWIEIASAAEGQNRSTSGIGSQTNTSRTTKRHIYVRVDRVR